MCVCVCVCVYVCIRARARVLNPDAHHASTCSCPPTHTHPLTHTYTPTGERATWPVLNRVGFMLRTENKLRACIDKLQLSLVERPSELRNSLWEKQISSLRSCNSLNGLGLGGGMSSGLSCRSSTSEDPRSRFGSEDGLDEPTRAGAGADVGVGNGAISRGGGTARATSKHELALELEVCRLRSDVETLLLENTELRSQLNEIQQLAKPPAIKSLNSVTVPFPQQAPGSPKEARSRRLPSM